MWVHLLQHYNFKQGLYYINEFPSITYWNVSNLLKSHKILVTHHTLRNVNPKIESELQNINLIAGSAVMSGKKKSCF